MSDWFYSLCSGVGKSNKISVSSVSLFWLVVNGITEQRTHVFSSLVSLNYLNKFQCPFLFLVLFALSGAVGPILNYCSSGDSGKKLEILKGNDKYNIIRNNSNNLLQLSLTDGLFRQ